MADNIAIVTGSIGGSGSISTDQLPSGEHVQYMKLMDGTADSVVKAVVKTSTPIAADGALVVVLSPNATGSVNLTTIAGTGLLPKLVPTGGTGLTAIPVYTNAIQLATYVFASRSLATGALTAHTLKPLFSFEHTGTSTKTVKIRRLLMSGYSSTNLIGSLELAITRHVTSSTAGVVVSAGTMVSTDGASEVVCKVLPTIAIGTVMDYLPLAAIHNNLSGSFGSTLIYDWQEDGEVKPWTIPSASLQSLVFNVVSNAVQNWTLNFHIVFSEE